MLSILINRWHPGTCRIQRGRRGTGLPEISGNGVSASYFRKPENEKISAGFILKNAVRLVGAAAVVAFVPAAAAFPHNAIVSHRVRQHDRTVRGGGFLHPYPCHHAGNLLRCHRVYYSGVLSGNSIRSSAKVVIWERSTGSRPFSTARRTPAIFMMRSLLMI